MSLLEISLHQTAKVHIRECKTKRTHWTTLRAYNADGSVAGEITFFSNGNWPVPLLRDEEGEPK